MGAVACAGFGAVQILPPEQEFDGMIAGGDVRLDPVGFVQGARDEGGRDLAGVDFRAGEGEFRGGDDIELREGVFLVHAIAGIDIVDQALVQRPGIHLAFPIVDDGVAEAEDLGLLIGDAGGEPGVAGGGEGGLGRGGDEGIDGGLQFLRGGQAVAIARGGDVGIGGDDGGGIGGKGRGGEGGAEQEGGGAGHGGTPGSGGADARCRRAGSAQGPAEGGVISLGWWWIGLPCGLAECFLTKKLG